VGSGHGKVMAAGLPIRPRAAGIWQRITIFLSPMDVHINRMPVSGT
jgi:phosphatidylserine decarboxylase